VDIELHWSPNNLFISKSNTSKKIPDILRLGYKEAIRGRDIYSAKKDTNRGGELGMNHDDKLFIYRFHPTRRDKIHPSVVRKLLIKMIY
jgi:hypothetical protein